MRIKVLEINKNVNYYKLIVEKYARKKYEKKTQYCKMLLSEDTSPPTLFLLAAKTS